jgi:outer membrane lipoprotein-sorting protein
MSAYNSPHRSDLITQVVDAFERMHVPPGPAVRETIEFIERAAGGHGRARTISSIRKRHMRTLISLATAAAIGAVLVVSFWSSVGGHLAFAQVLERIKEANAVSFKITVMAPGGPQRTGEALALSPNLSRVDWKAGDLTMIQIVDHAKLEATVLLPASKQFRVDKLTKAFNLDVVKRLREIDPKLVRRIEPEDARDSNTEVFEIRDGSNIGKMWVDSKTKLPIRYEMQAPEATTFSGVVYSDFDWDAKADASMFAIPQGYTEIVAPGQEPRPAQ